MDDYESFKKRVLELTTIDLNAYKERQMKRRIDSLIAKREVKGYEQYATLLKSNKEMFDEFVNFLTINVSEFYRNPEQWEILQSKIIPMLMRDKKSIKVWSAACSTGDEPYTLAMVLRKYFSPADIKITATDIDKQVLSKAMEGLYQDRSLKGLPNEYIKQYFDVIGDVYSVKPEIKKSIEFKTHDLLKDKYPDQMDIIVCRNVLIYFTEEAKAEIYKKFYDALRPGGVLFIGATEQIFKAGDIGFKSIESFYYQKPSI